MTAVDAEIRRVTVSHRADLLDGLAAALEDLADAHRSARALVLSRFGLHVSVDDPKLNAYERAALQRLRAAEREVRSLTALFQDSTTGRSVAR